jgi:hypothetical protein
VLASYLALSAFLSLFHIPAIYGLSTMLGTTVMGSTTVLGSTMLGTTTSMAEVYSTVLPAGQLAISLLAIGILIFLELSDPAYSKTNRLVRELRRSWLPLAATLIILFSLTVAFKVLAILA